MLDNSYSFSCFSKYCSFGLFQSLSEFISNNTSPVFICIGSDLVLGDSLGPLVGTLLKNKNLPAFIYGTLSFPVTAKEIEKARTLLKKTHPNSPIIAIDAAVGDQSDVGLIRVINKGLKPGLGVNKNLGTIGDVSIIGVVAPKSNNNVNLFNLTRLNLIYTMAEQIANGIEFFINNKIKTQQSNAAAFGT